MRKSFQRYGYVSVLATLLQQMAATPAEAQDASYGCKVFMCVASGEWQSIPYCVPYVQQALAQAALGVPWPICPEAMAGAVSGALENRDSRGGAGG
jgi:hypothetical protein